VSSLSNGEPANCENIPVNSYLRRTRDGGDELLSSVRFTRDVLRMSAISHKKSYMFLSNKLV
jgi:hypothetical protein